MDTALHRIAVILVIIWLSGQFILCSGFIAHALLIFWIILLLYRLFRNAEVKVNKKKEDFSV